MTLVCGRYEGVDERFIASEVHEELSIGDYVLNGGEVPAMVVLESLIRLLPGALGKPSAVDHDSFSDGTLDHPHYTRPEVFRGMAVPEVLRGGNHQEIRRWRREMALAATRQKRPDLLHGSGAHASGRARARADTASQRRGTGEGEPEATSEERRS